VLGLLPKRPKAAFALSGLCLLLFVLHSMAMAGPLEASRGRGGEAEMEASPNELAEACRSYSVTRSVSYLVACHGLVRRVLGAIDKGLQGKQGIAKDLGMQRRSINAKALAARPISRHRFLPQQHSISDGML
jgi:hypothetical protein